MRRFLKRYQLWLLYAVFLIIAWLYGSRESFVHTQSELVFGNYIILFVYLAFLAFSLYASARENFFRSIVTVNQLLWGRQVGIDLYISVFLSLALIYLIEGSFLVLLLWLLPILFFANLAILPYILLNYEQIVGQILT